MFREKEEYLGKGSLITNPIIILPKRDIVKRLIDARVVKSIFFMASRTSKIAIDWTWLSLIHAKWLGFRFQSSSFLKKM